MPRRPRICPAKTCFHVLNRAVARLTLFEKAEDYEAFERVLVEAVAKEGLPIFAYTVMPNHWHFVVRPETDSQLSDFFRWLTHTHTMRWPPIIIRKALVTCIRDGSRRFLFRMMITCGRCYVTWREIRFVHRWWKTPRTGSMAAFGAAFTGKLTTLRF